MKSQYIKYFQSIIICVLFIGCKGEAQTIIQPEQALQNTNPIEFTSNKELSFGHQKIRDLLGSDIGEMQFDSEEAISFRSYIANSLLSSRANSYDNGGYTDSNAKIQLCANGSFIQVLSGHVSIDVERMSAANASTDYMPGYWEVASLPNNMLIILFYSTHPSMLEDSPNGFLPFPVARYTSNFIAMPNGDGYSRTANQYCN